MSYSESGKYNYLIISNDECIRSVAKIPSAEKISFVNCSFANDKSKVDEYIQKIKNLSGSDANSGNMSDA